MRINDRKVRAIQMAAVSVLAVMAVLVPDKAGAQGTPADSTAIVHAVAELDSAWNTGNADRWATNYTPDCDFVNILGMAFPSYDVMRARHHEIMTGVFRGSRHEGQIRRLRFLGADAAVVDVNIQVTGFKALPPGSRPSKPGVLETRMKHVFQKIDGAWKIVASQNTAVAPPPPAPPAGRGGSK